MLGGNVPPLRRACPSPAAHCQIVVGLGIIGPEGQRLAHGLPIASSSLSWLEQHVAQVVMGFGIVWRAALGERFAASSSFSWLKSTLPRLLLRRRSRAG